MRNLTGDDAITGQYVGDRSSGLYTNIFTLEPRQYGVAAGFRFRSGNLVGPGSLHARRRRAMADDLHKGDKVTWKSHGGKAHGKVEKKITSETTIKGHTAKATKDDPQYIVETDSGAKAAHKPDALKKG